MAVVVAVQSTNSLTSAVQVKVNEPSGKVYGFGSEVKVTSVAPVPAVPLHV